MSRHGEILNGRYRIQRTLGKGGMGRVYLAQHMHLDRPFAVKEMVYEGPPEEADDAYKLFKTEARVLMDLRHPGLPQVHDFFEAEHHPCMVMDYIDGLTLWQKVAIEGPQPEAEVLRWAAQLLDVLAYLHERDVIYRDLKPGNVMLDPSGHLRLIDFGLAKVGSESGVLTHPLAHEYGTPGFAAPEYYSRGSDALTDIYSLGATLYFLLTGVIPPPSTDIASGRIPLEPLLVYAPLVSGTTAAAIHCMLAILRAARPQSAHDVKVLLGLAQPAPPPPAPAEPLVVTPRKTRRPLLALVAAAMLGLATLWNPIRVERIQPGVAIGDIRIGSRVDDSPLLRSAERLPAGSQTLYLLHSKGLAAWAESSGSIVRIAAMGQPFETAGGVHVGSPLHAVLHEFGNDGQRNDDVLRYPRLGLAFRLTADNHVALIELIAPR